MILYYAWGLPMLGDLATRACMWVCVCRRLNELPTRMCVGLCMQEAE